MLRLGFVDCDTSHVYAFAERINHHEIEPEQWVEGARVVAASVGTSRILSAERIAEFVERMQRSGVAVVDSPADLLGQVDAVFITSNEGSVHHDHAVPFLEAGVPVFVDKPFTETTAQAKSLVELADRRGVPLISASALRFASEIRAIQSSAELGAIQGVDVFGPAHQHEANPGLLHYGIHEVEMLFALLGPGCREVVSFWEEGAEVNIGRWRDGRLGVMRGIRKGLLEYGGTIHGETAVKSFGVDARFIYRDMLAAVIPVLAGQPSPVSGEELVEVVAFMEAALASSRAGGHPVPVTA